MNLQERSAPIAARYHQPLLLYQDMEFGDISDIVRRVPTYHSLSNQDIRLESIAIDRILPIQMVLTQYKLRRAESVIRLHTQYGSKLFSPVPMPESILASRTKTRHRRHLLKKMVLWLPPIVEVHDDAFVLIDGHHRFYALCDNKSIGVGAVQVVVVRGVTEPLPCTPLKPLDEWMRGVKVDDVLYSLGRQNRYMNFQPSHWRDFKAMRPGNRRFSLFAR